MTQNAKKAGVIGWPVGHSKSPLIHGHWLQKYGIDATYVAISAQPDGLKREVDKMIADGFYGFNVTVPHKQAIIPMLDFVRADAERIGAVNTVVINPDGTLEGRNTDAFGFIENLKEAAPKFKLGKGTAIVLGAGGAARAIVYALGHEGYKDIRIFNRTLGRARELASAFPGAEGFAWDELPDHLPDAALLVNTTSLGMKGQPELNLNISTLSKKALVNDIVYNPLKTGLLVSAHARGNPVVTGIGMLLHQARPAFQAWFGVMPDVDAALRKKVLA